MTTNKQLNFEQIQHFNDHGYLVVNAGIEFDLLKQLDEELEQWIELSRNHETNFGTTVDGKARFDLEVGHSQQTPKLRRVSNTLAKLYAVH